MSLSQNSIIFKTFEKVVGNKKLFLHCSVYSYAGALFAYK